MSVTPLPPPPPGGPRIKCPLMRFARPAVAEAIERLKALHERNPEVEQLLENAIAWPTVAAGLTKEEVKEIRCQAGLILFTFNTDFSSLDGKGLITF